MNHLFLQTQQSYSRFKHFFAAYQVISGFAALTSTRRSSKAKHKGLDKVLNILDFVIPKTTQLRQDDRHQRLIRSCMQDLLEIDQEKETVHRVLPEPTWVTFDENFNCDAFAHWSTKNLEKDSLIQFPELHERGISLYATLSSTIRSCASNGAFDTSPQVHAFSVKIGIDGCVFIGSSLISLYSKCGKLDDAYQVFQGIPTKNTVLWSAIISGYALRSQLETCQYLFNSMRHSNLKPNDFTYASLLSACTNCGSLALGRSFHCLDLRTGYESYTHVSNALISMYAKCGIIEEALYVFEKLPLKDLISWNSMIFGYAHYGIADQALDLLKEMDEKNISPDTITFLGVLSSCRHAGFVDKGRECFNSMLERGIKPEIDHYSCIVDLLGRAGLLEEAIDFIEKMPIAPNSVVWGSVLSSSRVHGNVWIGIRAAERRLLLEPGCAATHVQLANLHASIHNWNDVGKIRKRMKERGLKTKPGYSWIEIGNEVHRFKAEDGTNAEVNEMISILDALGDHMQCLDS